METSIPEVLSDKPRRQHIGATVQRIPKALLLFDFIRRRRNHANGITNHFLEPTCCNTAEAGTSKANTVAGAVYQPRSIKRHLHQRLPGPNSSLLETTPQAG